MKHHFNLDDFEEFFSDSAEQHRMYPSDKVWRNINKDLHGNKRWPALTFGAILTGAIITAGLILIHPDKSFLNADVNSAKYLQAKTEEDPAIAKLRQNAPVISNFSAGRKSQSQASSVIGTEPLGGAFANADTRLENSIIEKEPEAAVEEKPVSEIFAEPILHNKQIAEINVAEVSTLISSVSEKEAVENALNTNHDVQEAANADPNAFNRSFAPVINTVSAKNIDQSVTQTDLTLELKILTPTTFKVRQAKWSSYFYLTPGMSYRYLAENRVVDLHRQFNGPLATNSLSGVNNYVRHRAIPGIEIGGGYQYQLTENVRLKMGLQVASRGYSIDAYASSTEQSAIVLNRGFYTDALQAYSNINNFAGYSAINITNRYFEIGAPVALEMKMAGKKRLKLYAAAGVQPTYQFNKGMYVLSNDYKNYVQQPGLSRHFNINSALEAFVSYKTKTVTWQFGPQLKYQMLSGTTKAFPVREHLFDYGIKLGIVKSLQ